MDIPKLLTENVAQMVQAGEELCTSDCSQILHLVAQAVSKDYHISKPAIRAFKATFMGKFWSIV